MKPEVVIDGVNKISDTNIVAERFSAAAKTYSRHNCLQKRSAQGLLKEMSPCGVLLDIGCGPGTDFSHFKRVVEVISLDIAPGMLEQLSINFPSYTTICADAKAIPLPENSVDTVYSNLALQWCDDLQQSFKSTGAALKSGGDYYLSVVAEGSLPELVELGFRVNSFRSMTDIVSQFDPEFWLVKSAKLEPITVYFDDLKSLLYSIKGVGASIVSDEKSSEQNLSHGIRGREDWKERLARAECIRQAKGLPLTYHIAQLHVERR
ncbi:methyltransferase domain-containing protein [Shewanella woodyi]|uniref:Methyltransferase type 11 n=1 Tax=Shewanella woodyi (strain ATCC 51908 / MS32) TaxID=392500 RepID=B1KPJ9_SHEWM|nr:methyltransferase domain-containing protein [Shewanella woodyi]ACA86152.1 Methyltransferase type 11 [Shewanella woodyi ATCC 51908]